MNIAVFGQKTYAGSGLYRQHFPHELLAAWGHKVLFTDSLAEEDYDGFDIFMAHKSWFVHANDLVTELKKNGIITIIDFDDYWVLPPSHVLYQHYRNDNTSQLLIDGLRLYDYVSCTTDILRDEIAKINPNVAVFENAIDPSNPQFEIKYERGDLVEFGWVGGHCHHPDISLLEGTPQKLTGDFAIRLFGHDGEQGGVYDGFAEILSGRRKLVFCDPPRFFVHSATTSRMYTQFYNYFDVAIVPLVKDKFNSMKSELKMIEAGFMKKAVIVSDVDPYRSVITKDNCLTVVHKQHWAKRMQRLIDNPNQIEDLAEALYESVKDRFDLHKVTRRREQWYQHILDGR